MLVAKYKTQFVFRITASCLLLILAVFLFVPFNAVQASPEIVENLDVVAGEVGYEAVGLRVIIGRIIKIFLGFVGTIALIIVIYAGYSYMTSGGDPAKVDKAKKWLTNGVIGLVIIFSAYAITSFLLNALTGIEKVPTVEYDIASISPKGLGYGLSGNAFGEILSGHSPTPEQKQVPRNTMILVSFKLPVNAESLINTAGDYSVCPATLDQCKDGDCPADKSVCGPVDVGNFKLFRCDAMPEWPAGQAPDKCFNATIGLPDNSAAVPGYIILTADRKTVIFNPHGDAATHIGSPDMDVSYIVQLGGGTTGIKKLEPASESVFDADGYKWRFTTSTLIDSTPPKVLSVIPKDQAGIDDTVKDITLDDNGKVKRNTIILVNFNEPVIPPLSASQAEPCIEGFFNNEAQIKMSGEPLDNCSTGHVPGEWTVGINQYKTIQFIPSAKCEGVEINSCGEPVFCLPANKELDGKVLAAIIESGITMIGTGIMDLASNSLDGNDDGEASGTADDNYDWSFGVGNTVDLVPPAIMELSPKNASENVDPFVPIKAIFNKPLEPATVDSSIYLYGENYAGWFDPNLEITEAMNSVSMTHGPFYTPSQASGEAGPLYMPIIKSQVRDIFQNCFTPSRSVLGTTYNEAGEVVDDNQELTSTTNTTCDSIGVGNYGRSCCVVEGQGFELNEQIQQDNEDLNECAPVGDIER